MSRYILPIVALFLFLLCVAACAAAGATVHAASPAVRWFAPNLLADPADARYYEHWDTLFTPGSDYTQVLGEIDAFGFNLDAIARNPNNWISRAVPLLRANGVKVFVGGGYVGCTNPPEVVANWEMSLMQNWYAAGGVIDFIQLDDPQIRLQTQCHYTTGQVDSQIVTYMQTVHAAHPEIKFYSTVSYPNWPDFGTANYWETAPWLPDYSDVLAQELGAINNHGERLYGLDVDSPYEYNNCSFPGHGPNCAAVDWWGRIAQLEAFAEQRGLAFGLIYNSATSPDDATYFARTNAGLNRYWQEHTNPKRYSWMSWYVVPTHLVPVTQPYTNFYDVNYFFRTPRGTCAGVPGLICP